MRYAQVTWTVAGDCEHGAIYWGIDKKEEALCLWGLEYPQYAGSTVTVKIYK